MSSRKVLANAIRALSMDGVQKANSGHPGAPMGMADIAEVLWRSHLNHNPQNPNWADRDRFILAADPVIPTEWGGRLGEPDLRWPCHVGGSAASPHRWSTGRCKRGLRESR